MSGIDSTAKEERYMKPFPSGRGRGPVATPVRPAQRYAALVLDGCLHRPPQKIEEPTVEDFPNLAKFRNF